MKLRLIHVTPLIGNLQKLSTISWISKNYLEFFFFKTVFEEHEYRHGLAVNVTVLQEAYNSINVQRRSSEKLQFLETSQNILHNFVHIGFKYFYFVRRFFLKFCNQSAQRKIVRIKKTLLYYA